MKKNLLLLQVLRSNGTGLLDGLCRPHIRNRLFKGMEVHDRFEVDFSLGIENLGTYTIEVTSVFGGDISAKIHMENVSVILLIKYSDELKNFGKFMARDDSYKEKK